MVEEDYGTIEKRKYGEKFLGNILEEPEFKGTGLEPIFQKIAEEIYFTTFTDDSGHIPGYLGIEALVKYWSDGNPTHRLSIECFLDYLKGTNWIVDAYIRDFAKEIGYEKYLKLGLIQSPT